MAQPPPQNAGNHARYVPLYHFVLGFILIVLLVLSMRAAIAHTSQRTLFDVLLVVALVLASFYTRSFALAAQDRVIRLELKLRIQALAPQLMPRFAMLTPGQLTALRFAGDAELPALAQRVLDGQLTKGADIKRQIQDWQPDHMRV